jgi:hypothetical protein
MIEVINKVPMEEVRIVQGQFIGKNLEKKCKARPFETEEYRYN